MANFVDKTVLMDKQGISRALVRIAHEIVEKNKGVENIVLVGVRSRGVPLSERVADAIEKIPVSVWVDVMQRWFVDLLLAVHAAPARYYPSLEKQTAKIARAAAPQALADTSRWLGQQRALADHPLNAKLLVHTSVQRIMLALAPRQVQ